MSLVLLTQAHLSIMVALYVINRYDELKDILRTLRNSQKIKDIAKVQTGSIVIVSRDSKLAFFCVVATV